MATIVPFVIDSDGVTGDYGTLASFLAAVENNLATGDVAYEITLQSSTNQPFNEVFSINQFTNTSITNYVKFIVSGPNPVRFEFPADPGQSLFYLADPYIYIDGGSPEMLQFIPHDNHTASDNMPYVQTSPVDVKNFTIRGKNKSNISGPNPAWSGNSFTYFIADRCNMQFYGGGRDAGNDGVFDHVTAYMCATGLRGNSNTVITNSALFDSVQHSDFYDASRSSASSNNATSDATADDVGLNNQINLVATDHFVDPANGDFTLKPTSSLIGAGTGGSDIGAVEFTGQVTTVTSGALQVDNATVSGSLSLIPNTNLTVSGSIQAEAAAVSGTLSNDPVSEIVTDTITTAAGVGGSIQAQDAVISGSLSVTSSAANSTVSGSIQAVPASVDGTLLVVPPQTAVISGGVQAQPATLSGSLLAFIPYRFKYTAAAKLFSAFGKTEMALITSPEHATVSGDLFYAVMMNNDVSAWSLQQIADANDAASRLADTIQSAEHLIDSYISPRYALPLSQDLVDTSPLPTYCNHIVRFMLMDDRTTDEVDKRYDQAMKWLRDVSMNKASLGVDDTAVASSPGRMVSRRGRSKLNWDGF